jgi:quinol monooxygenase YgiN
MSSSSSPFLALIWQYDVTSSSSKETVLNALRTSIDHQVAEFPGTRTYLFAESATVPDRFHFIELYDCEATLLNHAAKPSVAAALAPMFTAAVRKATSGVLVGAAKSLTDSIAAIAGSMNGVTSPVLSGELDLVDSDEFKSANGATDSFVAVLVAVHGKDVVKLINACTAIQRAGRASTAVVFADGDSKKMLLVGDAFSLCDAIAGFKFTPASVDVFGAVVPEAKQRLADKATFHARTIGFALHPATKQALVRRSAGGDAAPAPKSTLFTLKFNEYTHVCEALVFDQSAPGRSAHLSSPKREVDPNVVQIPVLHVLRKILQRGSLDTEFPMLLLFGQLARLRALRDDLAIYAALAPAQRGEDERVSRLLEQVTLFGFPPRSAEQSLVSEGLGDVIDAIEFVFAKEIGDARRELASSGTITYRGLFELYRIGALVYTAAGALGGQHIGVRLVDMQFTPLKSMFNTQKLVFRALFECAIGVGGSFAVCRFEETLEDWDGAKSVSQLQYQPLSGSLLAQFEARGERLGQIGTKPVYRAYSKGSFFARTSSSATAATSSASAGRCMVDNERGLSLGHTLCASFDGIGAAIASTIKAYRVVLAAQRDGEPAEAQRERLQRMQLQLHSSVSPAMRAIVWPAVLCFSLSTKCWGYCLVEGLSEIVYDGALWSSLELPPRTKELLLATGSLWNSSARLRKATNNADSNGALMLLYGPPGTGKTLTVSALAERFHRPLYVASFGELGTTTTELETNFTNILTLCRHWGALCLLDEGDALVEKRTKGALLQNSLVGVLLRTLDSFEGQLFLTTNRVKEFDPAALSRVTLAIRYDPLTNDARAKIWRNFLSRLGCDTDKFDVDKLASFELSGRDLNQSVKLGMALAELRGKELDMESLLDAVEEGNRFRSTFTKAQTGFDE